MIQVGPERHHKYVTSMFVRERHTSTHTCTHTPHTHARVCTHTRREKRRQCRDWQRCQRCGCQPRTLAATRSWRGEEELSPAHTVMWAQWHRSLTQVSRTVREQTSLLWTSLSVDLSQQPQDTKTPGTPTPSSCLEDECDARNTDQENKSQDGRDGREQKGKSGTLDILLAGLFLRLLAV